MPPILTQRSTVIALILLLVGGYFHFRGRHLSSDSSAMLTQGIGLLFDIVAANISYFFALHEKNKGRIASNVTAINYNADVLDKATPATTPVMKVTPDPVAPAVEPPPVILQASAQTIASAPPPQTPPAVPFVQRGFNTPLETPPANKP